MKRRSTEIMQGILKSKEDDVSAKQFMSRYDIEKKVKPIIFLTRYPRPFHYTVLLI